MFSLMRFYGGLTWHTLNHEMSVTDIDIAIKYMNEEKQRERK